MHSPIFVKQKHTLFIAKSQWLHQHRIPLTSVKTFAKNENYFQIRSPKITALLCPFPALSHAETPRFSRNCAKSNIVGYNTVDAPAAGKFKAFAVQFENIGETAEIAIPDLFTYENQKGAANGSLNTCDKIWLWDSSADDWVKYYYRKVGVQAAVGWCKNGETVVTTDTVKNGDTVFFYRGSGAVATSLTLSGSIRAITASASYTTPEAGKFAFMAYPWPVAMPIGTFDTYQGAPKGAANGSLNTPDKIWLWDTTADDWIKYYYRKVGVQAAVGWCKNGETTVTTDAIPAGEGFFFYRGSGAAVDTITFTPPAGN